jgi:hypothetical protein
MVASGSTRPVWRQRDPLAAEKVHGAVPTGKPGGNTAESLADSSRPGLLRVLLPADDDRAEDPVPSHLGDRPFGGLETRLSHADAQDDGVRLPRDGTAVGFSTSTGARSSRGCPHRPALGPRASGSRPVASRDRGDRTHTTAARDTPTRRAPASPRSAASRHPGSPPARRGTAISRRCVASQSLLQAHVLPDVRLLRRRQREGGARLRCVRAHARPRREGMANRTRRGRRASAGARTCHSSRMRPDQRSAPAASRSARSAAPITEAIPSSWASRPSWACEAPLRG